MRHDEWEARERKGWCVCASRERENESWFSSLTHREREATGRDRAREMVGANSGLAESMRFEGVSLFTHRENDPRARHLLHRYTASSRAPCHGFCQEHCRSVRAPVLPLLWSARGFPPQPQLVEVRTVDLRVMMPLTKARPSEWRANSLLRRLAAGESARGTTVKTQTTTSV